MTRPPPSLLKSKTTWLTICHAFRRNNNGPLPFSFFHRCQYIHCSKALGNLVCLPPTPPRQCLFPASPKKIFFPLLLCFSRQCLLLLLLCIAASSPRSRPPSLARCGEKIRGLHDTINNVEEWGERGGERGNGGAYPTSMLVFVAEEGRIGRKRDGSLLDPEAARASLRLCVFGLGKEIASLSLPSFFASFLQ